MTASGDFNRVSREAVLAAYRGRRVSCAAEAYPHIRQRMVAAVQFLVDEHDEEAAERVMLEVLRLDGVHGVPEAHS